MPKLIKFLNYRFYTAQKNRSSRPETFYREAVQKRKKTTTTTARHGRIPSYPLQRRMECFNSFVSTKK